MSAVWQKIVGPAPGPDPGPDPYYGGPQVPQTGDALEARAVAALALLGAVLVIAALLCRREEETA